MNDIIFKDSITFLDSLSRLTINHLDTSLTKNTIDINSSSVFGIPENVARILIPAIVSIIILFLSQIFTWYFKKRERQLEIQSYRNAILSWIGLIELSVTKQIKACREFAKALEDSKNINTERFTYIKILSGKIDDISIDKFINTFIVNSTHPLNSENNEMTFNLVYHFSYLTAVEPEMSKTYSVYQDDLFSYMNEWNNSIIELDNLVSKYSRIINKNENNSLFSFHNTILTLCNKWKLSAPNKTITAESTINDLINPLTELVKQELSQNLNNEYAFEISALMLKFRILEKKWKTNIKGNAQNFYDYSKKIQSSYDVLKYSRDYFNNNTKIVNIWKIK